jgi:hypothetical protein
LERERRERERGDREEREREEKRERRERERRERRERERFGMLAMRYTNVAYCWDGGRGGGREAEGGGERGGEAGRASVTQGWAQDGEAVRQGGLLRQTDRQTDRHRAGWG